MDPFSGWVGDALDLLLSRFATSDTWQKETEFVSHFAASALAVRGGPCRLVCLGDFITPGREAAVSLLEAFFFARLRKGGLTFYAADGSELQWTQAKVRVASPGNLSPVLDTDVGTWAKLTAHCEGGYDAVYLDKAHGLVRFVQLRTSADAKSVLNIGFIYQFLMDLQQQQQSSRTSFEVTALKIFIIVEQGVEILEVAGKGLLAALPG